MSASSFSRAEFEAEAFDARRWVNSAMAGTRRQLAGEPPPTSTQQRTQLSQAQGQGQGQGAQEGRETDAAPSLPSASSSPSSSSALSHLTMKLQLMMADVESSLTQASHELTLGLPKALRELMWLGREVSTLRSSLSELLSDVYSLDREHHSQVQFLSAVDVVKRRVERVQGAVSEMEEWRRRAEQVHAVIESGDLHRIAAELSSLQRTVDSLAQLPPHLTSHHHQQVAQLRARLEDLCAPSFTAALQAKDLPAMARLCSVYRQMQRSDECRSLYIAHRQRQVQDIARAFVNGQHRQATDEGSSIAAMSVSPSAYGVERVKVLPSWLAAFHAALLSFVNEEVGCSAQLFPDDAEQSVLLSVLKLMSEEVAQCLRAWITAWLAGEDRVAHSGADHSEAIVGLFPLSLELVRAVTRTLRAQPSPSPSPSPSSPLQQSLDSITRLLLSPYTRLYPDLFSSQRSSALRSLDTLDLGADSYEPAAGQVMACLPLLLTQCDGLLHTCLVLTAGMRSPAVLVAVRELVDDFLGRVEGLVVRLKRVADAESKRTKEEESASHGGVGGRAMGHGLIDSGGGDDWSALSGLFALLAAVRRVEAEGVHELESSLRCRLLPAAVVLLAAVELQERGPDRVEEAEAAAAIDEEAERLSLFARLLREDEAQRRAVEDFVDRYHQQGLSSVQQQLQQRSGARPSPSHPAPSPALRPFNPSTPTSSDSSSVALSLPSLTSPATSSSLPSVPLFLASSVSVLGRVVLLLHSHLFEWMFGPISGRLQSFAGWRQWRSSASSTSSLGLIATEMREDGSESEVALPSFSLQPSDWATAIGEYLLSLVSVLEPFVAGEAAQPLYSELDAAYWLQRLATATCDLLSRCIASLPSPLSASTIQQLHTDLHYIANVLQAMAIDRAAHIAALQHEVTQRGERAGRTELDDAGDGLTGAGGSGPAVNGDAQSASRPPPHSQPLSTLSTASAAAAAGVGNARRA